MAKKIKLPAKQRRALVINLARESESEGDLELDDDDRVKISEGDDNGAYVQMWKWIDFSNTPLCKGENGNHDGCDTGCPVFDAAEAE